MRSTDLISVGSPVPRKPITDENSAGAKLHHSHHYCANCRDVDDMGILWYV